MPYWQNVGNNKGRHMQMTKHDMKTIKLTTIFILICSNLFSQDDFKQPDYEKIKSEAFKVDSRFYYTNLFARYLENDTTLDREDYVHLYYGFIYNDKYEPYGDSDLRRKVDFYAQRPESQLTSSDFDSLFIS